MALIRSASTSSSAASRTQFTIWSQSAGSFGTVYTVPAGKIFIGYILPGNPMYTIDLYFNINGVTFTFTANSTYGQERYFPIYLGSGDVVSNYSTSYFGLTGYEE